LWYEEIQQTIDMANAHNAEAIDRELHLVDLIKGGTISKLTA